MADRRWGAPIDQLDVERPFSAMPADLWPKSRERAVPMKHRPLGQASLSECVADGLLDVSPGDLVLDLKGRWCLVWNDAISMRDEDRH